MIANSAHRRLPRQCIVAPDVLRRIEADVPQDERSALDRTARLDNEFRVRRAQTVALGRTIAADVAPVRPGGQIDRAIYDQKNSTEFTPGVLVRSEDDPAAEDKSVNQAYDYFGATYDFYWKVFGRNSIDNRGLGIEGLVHYGTDYDNAFWDGDGHMFFGDGDGRALRDTTAGLDVIAHELTHGVTQHEANLVYSGQSGALNESVSDVFGVLVAQHYLGQTAAQADWLIGADIVGPMLSPALRSMKAPGTANNYDDQPATMAHYKKTTDDNGGVHTNSGIPNHAFYVVATTLGGHAWEAPGRIWYLTITDDKLSGKAGFATFAKYTLKHARTEYGAGSAEADAVADGWEAVGVKPAA